MIKRIGLLTSGGDCQALNATMRGVVKGLSNSVENLEVYGFDDGYKGLWSRLMEVITQATGSSTAVVASRRPPRPVSSVT